MATARHSALAEVVDRNIRALLERRRDEDLAKSTEERIAEAITRFTGSLVFVCLHVAIVALWVGVNTGWIPALPPFDPHLAILGVAASIEAIFLSTFVLITQNRMQTLAGKRAHLDLQISLLAEYEVTRLLTLVTAIARRMNLEESYEPELAELAKDVHPEGVLDRIEEGERKIKT